MAARDIRPLEIILTEAAAVVAPPVDSDPAVCCVCLKVRERLRDIQVIQHNIIINNTQFVYCESLTI